MKNIYSATLMLGLLIFASCKKNNEPAVNSSALPKTYTEDLRSSAYNQVATFNLTYDANNRLTSIVQIPESSGNKFIYQYGSGNSFTMDLYENNELGIHEILWLNGNSYLDSTYQYNNTNDTSTEKYEYNASNLLTRIRNYDIYQSVPYPDKITDYTYDINGNVITEDDHTGHPISFTYYPDLTYNFSMGQTYLPAPKNYLRTTSTDKSGEMVTATHFYSFDSSNRLVQDSASVSGIEAIVVKTYTY